MVAGFIRAKTKNCPQLPDVSRTTRWLTLSHCGRSPASGTSDMPPRLSGPEMQNFSVSFPCQYIHRQGPVAPSSQLVLGPGQDSRDRENAREQTSLRPLLSFTLYFLGFGEKSAFFQTNQSSSS